MKAYWTWVVLGLSSVALGSGCWADDQGPTGGKQSRALIDALMANVHIKGGLLQRGSVPDPSDSAETVKLATPNGTLRLKPGSSSIMALDVEHPDRKPALTSTLMQFEGAEDHFQVPIDEPGGTGASLALAHQFDVDEEVCDGLCNQRYEATLIVAMELAGGAVTIHHEVRIVLDCRNGGDEAYCDGAPPPASDDEMDASMTPLPRIDGSVLGEAGVLRDGGSNAMEDASQGLDSGMDAAVDAGEPDAATEDAAQQSDATTGDAGPVEAPPAITSISPMSVTAGSGLTLTITGEGFSPEAVAHLDGDPLDTISVEDTVLVADVPSSATASAASLLVYVENTPGEPTSRSNVLYLTVNPPAGAPLIYDYSPDNGIPGDTVLIIASNLMGQTLTIEDAEGTPLTPGTVSSISWPGPGTVDTVEVVLPDGIATGPITVANEIGSYRGKIFNVGNNLTRLPDTLIESSTQYNDAQWSRASGADNKLATSFFTAVGDCATSCSTVPWFEITFAEPQTVARIAMRGNREYYTGYDFIRGRFEVFGADDELLFQVDRDLPAPDRDVDLELSPPIEGAVSVKFSSLADESSEPGFSELEVFGP